MAEENPKSIEEITNIAQSLTSNIIKKKLETVVSVNKSAKGWKMVVEVLERKAIPDTQDILGRYEFELDPKGKLLGYKQIMLRHRSEIILEEKEE